MAPASWWHRNHGECRAVASTVYMLAANLHWLTSASKTSVSSGPVAVLPWEFPLTLSRYISLTLYPSFSLSPPFYFSALSALSPQQVQRHHGSILQAHTARKLCVCVCKCTPHVNVRTRFMMRRWACRAYRIPHTAAYLTLPNTYSHIQISKRNNAAMLQCNVGCDQDMEDCAP